MVEGCGVTLVCIYKSLLSEVKVMMKNDTDGSLLEGNQEEDNQPTQIKRRTKCMAAIYQNSFKVSRISTGNFDVIIEITKDLQAH